MGLKKGQASEAFKQGKMDKYNFRNIDKEKLSEISRKGVEKREEKRKARKAMKEQLEILLSLDVRKNKHKEILRDMGIEEDEMTNQMLMITALYRKALTGDVAAFKQINDIINGQTEDNAQNASQPPIINIVGVSPKSVKSKNGNVTINTSDEDEENDWE